MRYTCGVLQTPVMGELVNDHPHLWKYRYYVVGECQCKVQATQFFFNSSFCTSLSDALVDFWWHLRGSKPEWAKLLHSLSGQSYYIPWDSLLMLHLLTYWKTTAHSPHIVYFSQQRRGAPNLAPPPVDLLLLQHRVVLTDKWPVFLFFFCCSHVIQPDPVASPYRSEWRM